MKKNTKPPLAKRGTKSWGWISRAQQNRLGGNPSKGTPKRRRGNAKRPSASHDG